MKKTFFALAVVAGLNCFAGNAMAQNLYVGSTSSYQTRNFIFGRSYYSNTYIGYNFDDDYNVLTVANKNVLLSNSASIYVGNSGANNSLVISNGGTVQNTSGTIGSFSTASNNSVLVTDANSLWSNSSTLMVGDIGAGNSLVISNGGTVRNTSGTIGSNSIASNNSVLVTDANSLWSNSSTLMVGNIGAGNSLVISNGGTVRNTSGTIGNFSTASNNSVLVTGANSLWSNSSTLMVGNIGAGNSLVISNGGRVQNIMGVIGYNYESLNSVLVTGANSLWSNSSTLFVGGNGAGNSLVISNGGTVQGFRGTIGSFSTASNNSVLVTDANSLWSNSSTLMVGDIGAGNSLVISNGGRVQNMAGIIGSNSIASNNSVLVTDANSLWHNISTLVVAVDGSGTLTVANRGLVDAAGITIAADAGSSGTLNIGRFGTNDTAGTITAATIAFASGTGTINFNQSDSTTLTSSISGVGSVNQLGTGTTTLRRSNSYSGVTTISAGTLLFANANSLYGGNSSLWTATNIIVSSNATAAFGVGGVSGFTTSDVTTLLGNLTMVNSNGLQAGSVIGFDTTGGNFTLTNNIANSTGTGGGSLGLSKLGTGTLTLSGVNTYSGCTTISAGSLNLANSAFLTATTNVVVQSGGTLLLGAANQVNSAANLALAGGSLSMGGNGSTRASAQTFGTLALTANSVIDFANLTENSSITFSSITELSANSLSIWNWNSAEGRSTHLYDTQVGGLSIGDLANISFYSGSGTGLLGTGGFTGTEIIPVPEPSVVIAELLLLGSFAYGFRRKKKAA